MTVIVSRLYGFVRWCAAGLVLTVLFWGAFSGYAALDRPVTTVRIQGPTNAAQRAQVQAIVDAHLGRGVLSTDLHAIGAGLRKLEWTRDVNVRRVWPDRIVVELGRAMAIARWNDNQLLGEDGRSYSSPEAGSGPAADASASGATIGSDVPALFGPQELSREVLERYQVLRDTAAAAGLTVTRAGVDAKGEWSMLLDGRIPVMLGNADMLVRARRVVDLYTRHLSRASAQVAQMDARYANGVAVAWRNPDVPGTHTNVGENFTARAPVATGLNANDPMPVVDAMAGTGEAQQL